MTSRPNVLIIVTDDQRLAGTMAVLPKTEAWFHTGGELSPGRPFEGGTFFPSGVVTTPLCAPSRASVFTGRYAHNHGTQQNQIVKDDPRTPRNEARGPARFFQQLDSSLQVRLQSTGYRTGMFGKYFALLDRFDPDLVPHPLPGWDEYSLIADIPYAGFDVNENGVRKWIPRYSTDYIAGRADSFLQEAKNDPDERPWFLYLAPSTPHSPYVPAPKHAAAIVPGLDTGNPAYFEADRSDKPPWVQTSREDAESTELAWTAYLRTLKSADDLVDRVMRKLEELGETNTIAFFTSDHGLQWGEHGLRRKEKPYLESIHVPFFIRWPGRVASNETDDRLVANIDIAPTIVDAVNSSGGPQIDASRPVDGFSLLAGAGPRRSRILTEHYGAGPPRSTQRNFFAGHFPSWSSIRTDSFQYVEYYRTYARDPDSAEDQAEDSPAKGAATPRITDYDQVIAREYYDLTSDPNQLNNLLGDDDPTNDPPTNLLQSVLARDRECGASPDLPCAAQAGDPASLPAEVAITSAPSGTDADPGPSEATFTFTSTEPGSTFECRLDGGEWRGCDRRETFASLEPGWHALAVRAKAPSGEISDPLEHRWYAGEGAARTSDDVPGDEPGAEAPPQTEILPSASFSPNRTGATFYVGCGPDCPQDPRDLRFEGRLSATGRPTPPFRPCGAPHASAPRNFVMKTYDGLESGAIYTFEARAIDLAGNADPSPASYTWQVGPVQTFSDVPDLDAPDVTGNEVLTIVPDGVGGWYVGGDFTAVGDVPRANLVHLVVDAASGQLVVDTDWAPATDGAVRAMALCGGTLHVGGSFTSVTGTNGPKDRIGLAALAVDGAVTDWNPRAMSVYALALEPAPSPASIYVAGDFTSVGEASIEKLAKLDLSSGAPDTGWNANVVGGTIHALAVTEGHVYVGGESIDSIGGRPRSALAEIDRLGAGAVTDWDPSPAADEKPVVQGLALRQGLGGLDTILVAGRFSSIGSSPEPRMNAAEVNIADDGSTTSWDPQLDRDGGAGSASALLPFFCPHPGEPPGVDPTCSVIVAGAFDTVKAGSAAQATRRGLAETDRSAGDPSDARSGSANDWNADIDGEALAIACWAPGRRCDTDQNRTLAVGGRFSRVGDAPRGRLAFFRMNDADA